MVELINITNNVADNFLMATYMTLEAGWMSSTLSTSEYTSTTVNYLDHFQGRHNGVLITTRSQYM